MLLFPPNGFPHSSNPEKSLNPGPSNPSFPKGSTGSNLDPGGLLTPCKFIGRFPPWNIPLLGPTYYCLPNGELKGSPGGTMRGILGLTFGFSPWYTGLWFGYNLKIPDELSDFF